MQGNSNCTHMINEKGVLKGKEVSLKVTFSSQSSVKCFNVWVNITVWTTADPKKLKVLGIRLMLPSLIKNLPIELYNPTACFVMTNTSLRSGSYLYFGLPLEQVSMLQFTKNTSVISYCTVLQHCIRPLSETLFFRSCLFKAPLLKTSSALIGQLTHGWAGTSNSTARAADLDQFLCE